MGPSGGAWRSRAIASSTRSSVRRVAKPRRMCAVIGSSNWAHWVAVAIDAVPRAAQGRSPGGREGTASPPAAVADEQAEVEGVLQAGDVHTTGHGAPGGNEGNTS